VLGVEWIPVGAWIAAVVVAIVVLGFCAYELIWKTRRLQRDVAQLQSLNTQLADVQSGIAAAQQRIGAAGATRPR
jgi:outer membrane murein-binding lipoprotein Lpp